LRTYLAQLHRLTGPALALLLVAACKTMAPVATPPPPPAKPVVLTLGSNKTFSSDEFFESFAKNQLSADSSQRTDLRGYLDLYTNLKLKVFAAEQQGHDTTEAVREELATYRKQLAQTYLTDKALVEQLTAEAYQRMQQEVNVSHILIATADDDSPADTLVAYEKALAVRERLQKGEPFETVARQVSNDPTVSKNGGNIGYFSAFQTVYLLETAAYTQPVGTLSTPIRSRFGYHILKVNDRRPSRGKVQVAHILVRLSPTAEPAGETAAKARIDEVYAKLKAGEAFETLVRTYSDDGQSKSAGGKLPAFATGQMTPAFEEAAFGLNTPGSYSVPFRSNYGWHIVKLIDRKPMESFTELAPAIRQKVLAVTDSRADVLRNAMIGKLRLDYKVVENEQVKQAALAKSDSSLLLGKWRPGKFLDDVLTQQPLLTVADRAIPASEFFAYVQRKQEPRQQPGGSALGAMLKHYTRFVGDQLLATEEANLEKKYPEFRTLLNEVRDGVLLSQVMDEQVWGRSMADSIGQKAFYEQNKARYQFPQRAVAVIIDAADDQLLAEAKARLASSPYLLKRSAPAIQYAPNQTALEGVGMETAYDILVTMVKNPGYVLEITTSREATEHDTVSTARLRNIVTYLTKNGVTLTRITEKDVRVFRPGANTETTRDANRRATFTYSSTARQDVARVLSSQQPNAVAITDGTFAKGQNKLVDELPWQKGTSTFTTGNRVVQVMISRIEEARPRTFNEARGAVINDYQAFLERQYLAKLRQKYPVRVNEDELKRLLK
jgi:peptidyl-prolyl cis-trans isomerase SurA